MDKIDQLNERLNELQLQNKELGFEIDEIKVELLRLKVAARQSQGSVPSTSSTIDDVKDGNVLEQFVDRSGGIDDNLDTSDVDSQTADERIVVGESDNYFERRKGKPAVEQAYISNEEFSKDDSYAKPPKKKIDFEKLIGENLINKIGILIIIIGVAIGAKYSIDNDLINPLTRICLGYISGIVLLGLGLKLKQKYTNYSAVLVSGAMVIFYFITFFAFNFYELIGQGIAFGLMVLFTIFTVLASLSYDRQVIAHIGLIGAIAVPFLLSNDSGNVLFMFSYLLLIGIGVFVISLKKNWKKLFYSIFILTWIIYSGWAFIGLDSRKDETTLAIMFLCAFFVLFYAIFVTYKLMKLEKYNAIDIAVLILNSMIFYAIGYYILEEVIDGGEYLGLFTVANAVVHFAVARLIHQRKLADRNLFYLIIGFVLVFITMAIPVQLDGNWVTLIWMCEAALLFWIGRTKHVAFYEYMSYGIMLIALLSLRQDWDTGYWIAHNQEDLIGMRSLLNPLFLTSVVSILCFAVINWIANQKQHLAAISVNSNVLKVAKFGLPTILIGLIFFAFYREILYYFMLQFHESGITINEDGSTNSYQNYDYTIYNFKSVWLLNYTMLFVGGLSVLAQRMVKNEIVKQIILGFSLLAMVIFLVGGLYELSELREAYLSRAESEIYDRSYYYIWIRYVSLAFFGFLFWTVHRALKSQFSVPFVRMAAEIFYAVVLLWLLSSELIHWLDFSNISKEYGMALSILWGIFSVLIISLGIWKKKKHLRLLGMAIFGVTLLKLFFYDLAGLSSISKTIVLVSLGILLLGTSFLYNKYTVDEKDG